MRKIVCSRCCKKVNVKVINLVPGTNETRRVEWHETFKCKCRFNSSVCNNKQVGMMINKCVNSKN